MAIATGTALLIGAAISAGTQVAGAKLASNASKKAADQQVAATDKGLALQKDIYGQQVAGMQPYAKFGEQALGSLGSLMGFPALPAGAPPTAAAPVDPMATTRRATPTNGTGTFAVPRDGTLGSAMGGTSAYRAPSDGRIPLGHGPSQGQPGGSTFAMNGGTVRLQTPDGEQVQVPRQLAPKLIAAGAQEIG